MARRHPDSSTPGVLPELEAFKRANDSQQQLADAIDAAMTAPHTVEHLVVNGTSLIRQPNGVITLVVGTPDGRQRIINLSREAVRDLHRAMGRALESDGD